LVAKVLEPGPGDLKVAQNQSLVFDASYVRRAHLLMRSSRLSGLVVFHTHPAADRTVSFSPYDDAQEPMLRANLRELGPSTQSVSGGVGRGSLCGRVWRDGGLRSPLGELVVVGDTLDARRLDGRPEPEPAPPSAIFDRGLPLTGPGALACL